MRPSLLSTLSLLLAILFLIPSVPALAYDVQWPMERHDLRRTSLSPYSTAEDGPGEIWKTTLGGEDDYVDAPPLVGNDGVIYTSVRGKVSAIDTSGKIQWSTLIAGWGNHDISLTDEGDILVAGAGLMIIDHVSGEVTWSYQTDSIFPWFEWAICLKDGSMLFCEAYSYSATSYAFLLTKLAPDKDKEWTLDLDDNSLSPAAVAEDGTIYLGWYQLYAIDPEGGIFWNRTGFGSAPSVYSSPVIGPDGTIYFRTSWVVNAFSPNGTELWGFLLPSNAIYNAFAIDRDGNMLVGTTAQDIYESNGSMHHENPSLICLSKGGEMLWRRNLTHETTGITCSANGLIYAPTYDELLVMDTNGTILWQHPYRYISSAPVIAQDGTLYILVASDNSELLGPRTNLYAVRGEVGDDVPVLLLIFLGALILIMGLAVRWAMKLRTKVEEQPPRDEGSPPPNQHYRH